MKYLVVSLMFLFSVVLQAQVDVEKAINEARQKKGNEVLIVDSTMMRSIQVMQYDGKLNNYKKYNKVELRNAFQKYGFYDYDYEFVQLKGADKKSFDINRKVIFNKSLRSAIKKAEYNSISYIMDEDGQVVNVLISKKTIVLEEPRRQITGGGFSRYETDIYSYYKDVPSGIKDSCFVLIKGYLLEGNIDDLKIESDHFEVSKYSTGESKLGRKREKNANYFEFLLYSDTVTSPQRVRFTDKSGAIKAEYISPYVSHKTKKFVYQDLFNPFIQELNEKDINNSTLGFNKSCL